ncbi:phBC6A51 family helix-turn-helix protein [Priestia megaterium]|uniref:phBC6A51 family helix-turn-helix protein n=1 Tax=Priestia megaterium TaxID=1404 RepID=UPI0039F7438B
MTLRKLDDRHYEAIALLLEGRKTQREIAEEIGVHYNTITNWQRDELFQRELKRSVVSRTHNRLGELVDSMMEHAIQDGNAALAKLVLTMNDMLTERVNVDAKVDANSGVDYDAIDSEIEAFAKRIEGGTDNV